jgi:hypothetical protein
VLLVLVLVVLEVVVPKVLVVLLVLVLVLLEAVVMKVLVALAVVVVVVLDVQLALKPPDTVSPSEVNMMKR